LDLLLVGEYQKMWIVLI